MLSVIKENDREDWAENLALDDFGILLGVGDECGRVLGAGLVEGCAA